MQTSVASWSEIPQHHLCLLVVPLDHPSPSLPPLARGVRGGSELTLERVVAAAGRCISSPLMAQVFWREGCG